MSEVKTYAVNCNDAWLNTDGDDISGSYVKYKDHQEVVAAIESKCEALAEENANLKEFISLECMVFGDSNNLLVAEPFIPQVQATDAFLAEVRAHGVEMFAQWCSGERDFTLIDEDVADAAAYEECIKRAEYFAAQLRKEGEQK